MSKSKRENPETTGRFAYGGLERLIHEKARLSIVASLANHPQGLLFTDLKELCALTDGNLSRHLQLLEQAKLVEVWKGFKGRRPQTLCRLSAEGRERFLEYVAELEKVVRDAAASEQEKAGPATPRTFRQGFSPA